MCVAWTAHGGDAIGPRGREETRLMLPALLEGWVSILLLEIPKIRQALHSPLLTQHLPNVNTVSDFQKFIEI